MIFPRLSGRTGLLPFVTRCPENYAAFLRASFPLTIILLVALGFGATERLSFGQSDPQLGRMKRSQALSFTQALCTRIAGTSADAFSITGYTNVGETDSNKRWHEWHVLCHAGSYQYTFRINADRCEVVVIHRERADLSPLKPDIHINEKVLSVSRRNANAGAIQGRRYLALVGLPVAADLLVRNQDGYNFTYQVTCPPLHVPEDAKMKRLLRVRLDPEDGSLVYLLNSVSRTHAQRPFNERKGDL